MKKLTFLIACALAIGNASAQTDAPSRSRDEAYDPLVREGKIWWYAQSQGGGRITEDFSGPTMEYGFTFNGQDIITEQTFTDADKKAGAIRDEGPWNKLDVIRKVEVDGNTLIFYDTPFPAHYLKEDEKVVKVMDAVPNTRIFDQNNYHFIGLSINFDWNKDKDGRMLPILYNFSDNEEDLLIGDEGMYLALKFKSKERKNFFGTERLVKTFVKPNLSRDEWNYDPLKRVGEDSEIEITEGIGLTAIRNTRNDFSHDPNELFFAPYTYVPDVYPTYAGQTGHFYGSREPMQLRYVTDMDYNIIYEGIGGIKAWELDPSGVEDVNADKCADEQWYTLSGVKISNPTQAGVYIHRIGSRTEKVAIQ